MKLREFTTHWWEDVVDAGPERVNTWLRRLYHAEIGGAIRFVRIMDDWAPEGDSVIDRIAQEEHRHAQLVMTLLWMRGQYKLPDPPSERYWDPVWAGINSYETACAAAAYGEMLARNRFKVIYEHPCTPEDVRFLVALILPDEERHARLLGNMAGPEAMRAMRQHHRTGMEALGLPTMAQEDSDEEDE